MSLVPEKLDQFQTEDFWNTFFKTRGDIPFEWYCDYEALKPFVLEKCRNKRILIPGCGNSDLSAKL